MFVHAVYFWLRENLTAAERKKFLAGVRSLRAIEGVKDGYIGVPAPTDRPVIERGYSQSLLLIFPDQAAHDAYQTHPVHDRFRKECSGFWTSVRIYDSISEDDSARASQAANRL
jgi:hypothetical protein